MENNLTNTELAKLLVPGSTPDLSEIETRYPKRELPEGARVVRVAPSPTGFTHFGLIFAAIVNEHVAYQSKGVFFLRIEDTDKKREVVGGTGKIISSFKDFDIKYSEGPISESEEMGKYGPYIQSERQEIYLSAIKQLIESGSAYPCFCDADKLAEVRKVQELHKEKTGYYGKYATCRNLSLDEVKEKLAKNTPFTIRFRSPENSHPSKYDDAIKGQIELPENDVDYILVKSAIEGLGLPVYHLAAMVDDHLMGVNLVIRGDEWLPSLPLHLQVIDAFGWKRPKFGHLSPVMKMDGEITKRKLSKRKDPEAAAMFYLEKGIPAVAVRAYVLNIADSKFEDWRKNHPHSQLLDFPFALSHMGSSGALFDMTKFLDICKQEISYMTAPEIYPLVKTWAERFNPQFLGILTKDEGYSTNILNIERQGEKNRKDIAQWSQIPELFGYFYDEIYNKENIVPQSENVTSPADVKNILEKYLSTYNRLDTKDEWFNKLKSTCTSLNFASSIKEYKADPQQFKGHLGDIAMILRIALSGKTMTPDLYEMMQAMGEIRVISRLKQIIQKNTLL